MSEYISSLTKLETTVLVIGLAVVAHALVVALRRVDRHFRNTAAQFGLSKVRTVTSLTVSGIVFCLYFGAGGVALNAMGVPLGAYLASASIIGLAVAFGSQGVVQDVVTGLTIVFSNLFHLGDMVEISGQTGIVHRFGMRFTVLMNANGAEVFIPNRTINNVISYPRGYIRCLCDITLPFDQGQKSQVIEMTEKILDATTEQYPGILRAPAEIEGSETTSSGRTYLRVKFRIWPGRGAPIEIGFRNEVLHMLRSVDPSYADWMVSVAYEVEKNMPRADGRSS